MRKITLIFSLLLAMVTTTKAVDDPAVMNVNTSKVYTIQFANNNAFVYCNSGDVYYDASYVESNGSNVNYQFTFSEAGTDAQGRKLYYIASVGQEGYYAYNENTSNEGGAAGSVGLTNDSTTKADKGVWYVFDDGTHQYIVPAWKGNDGSFTRGGCCWNKWSSSNNNLGMWGRGTSDPNYAGDNNLLIKVYKPVYETEPAPIPVEDGVYTIQADENGKRGYLAASSGYDRPVLTEISWSEYSGNSCTDIVENGKYWYVKTINGVTYLSNIGNGGFIYDNGTDNIYFGAPFGLNFAEYTNGGVTYIHAGSGTGERYLSMGCGRTAPNQVNWETGNASDGGCLLTFKPVEYGTTTYATQIAAADFLIETSKKYSSFGVYTINNNFNGRGTLAYGTYDGKEYFGLNNITLSGYADRSVTVENDANKYWCIAQTEKGMYIYNIGKGVFLQNRTGDVVVATCSQNVATGYTFEERTNGGNSYVSIKNGNYYLTFSPGWYPNQGAVRWLDNNEEAATLLTLTSVSFANYVNELIKLDAIIDAYENPYTLNVTDAGWATLYLDFPAQIPNFEGEDAGAYIVTGVKDGNWLNLVKVTGTLPANTGIIVKANKGTYDFVYSVGDLVNVEENLLEGTAEDTYIAGAAYVLGIDNSVVGLYNAALNKNAEGAEGTTHFKNNANKAYLPATAVPANAQGVSFYGFRFDNEEDGEEGTTAIENVETATVNVIYDLSGRRVSEITAPGIYIVGGRKVLVK